MPLVDPNDPASWKEATEVSFIIGSKNVRLRGYLRAGLLPAFEKRAADLIAALDIVDGRNVIILGAGYGWTAEYMRPLLPSSTILAVDISALIHSKKGETETADYRAAIINAGLDPDSGDGAVFLAAMDDGGTRARGELRAEDVSKPPDRNTLKSLAGTDAWVITEDILPWATDTEAVDLSTNIRKAFVNVAHLITPLVPEEDGSSNQNPAYNWKLIADWKALLTPDLVISSVTMEVL